MNFILDFDPITEIAYHIYVNIQPLPQFKIRSTSGPKHSREGILYVFIIWKEKTLKKTYAYYVWGPWLSP